MSWAALFTTTILSVLLAGLAVPPSAGAEEDDPAPVLGGQLFSTGTPVTVEVLSATAGYTSTLFLLEPEEVRIATNRDVGTSVTVGPYGDGEELVFGIRVNGQEFRLGDGARNPDGIPHAVVDFGPDGCAVVGFEDLFGGGDRDYDDNRFRFCGGIAPEEPEDPEDPPSPDPVQPPVADAGPAQTVPEGSVVTLDGSGSRASTRPALQASQQQGALPGGTSLGAALDGLDPDATGLRVQGSVDIGQGPAVQNTSLAYVLDVSGSTGGRSGCGGDANNDRSSNTILDCEITAALKLHEKVAAAGSVDKVSVIRFSTGASALDLDPTSASATLVSPSADKDDDGVLDVEEALRSLRVGGGTNFLPPTRLACQLLGTTGSPNLLTAFMSDGQGYGAFSTVLPCDPPVEFQTFAVGSGSHCSTGSPAGHRLVDLATLSGGDCTDVPTVTTLPDILPSVIASRITRVTYTVDDGEPVDISDQLTRPLEGPATADLAFDLPDSVGAGTHRICLTVTGEDFGGTSSQTTCSDLVTVTGTVGYSWRVASADGPPVLLISRTTAHPTFVAADDGRYVLELTVSDGTGGTATDTVEVTVTNVDPVVELSHGDSFAGGVTQVNGTLTDEGWQDTHTATVDWGDGSSDEVTVTTAGAGWGTFFGSHVYRAAGSYDVVVTLHDDDGGNDVASVDHLEVQAPVAVWANSTSARSSLDWSGGSGSIEGRVHTNGQLRFVGAAKTVVGPTTYAGDLSADTTKNSFVPAPAAAPVQDFPFRPEVADFRPGRSVAVEVGSAYHDMSAECVDGSWHDVQSVLPSGVYYADCDIMLNGSQIGGRVTLVSEGHVKVSGSKPAFQPYYDGLLVVAGAAGAKAVDVSTSSSKFLGVLFAGSGEVSISGNSNRFFCGVLGDTVAITGSDVSVRGAACGRPDATVSGPVVIPDLAADIAVDTPTALPSDQLGYDVSVSNRGTTLVVPSLVGLENVDSSPATLTGYSFAVERQDAGTGEWTPVASQGDPSMRLSLRSNAFPGVTYPADGSIAGTAVEPGGWATWGMQAVLTLTPDSARRLLDPERTSGVRTRVDFELAPDGVQVRRLYTYGTDFATKLRALGADATDVEVTSVLPDGDAAVATGTDEPALGRVAPGQTATVHRTWTVPVPAPRGSDETDAGYLARLLGLDGTALHGAAFVMASGGVGRLVAPLVRASSTRQLPVVGISTTGAGSLPAGATEEYALKLANLGSAQASGLGVEATADGESLPVTGSPSTLDAGELSEATTSYTAPPSSSGTLTLRGEATWTDARGNSYGATGSSLDVERQVPAALRAGLTDVLQTDANGDGIVTPGDTVRYTVTVRNAGGLPLTGIDGSVPIDRNSSLVADSGRTPDGGTIALADGTATFSLPDVPGGTARSVTFDVVVVDPFPAGVARMQVQGSVSADGLDPVLTDDPALAGAADPTRTTVTIPSPALTATMTGRMVVDADGSGVLSAGDTLAYSVAVSSIGTQQVTGVRVVVHPPAGTSLVADSVTTSQGSVASDAEVDVAIGGLAPFQQATVTFRLRLDDPLPAGMTAVDVSGTISSDQLDPFTTDDPQTVEVGDASSIPIGDPASNPELPGPTVGELSPADGSRIATPTTVTATLTAPTGATVTTWKVVLEPAGGGLPTVLATGTGDQPTADVSATVDPTLLDNGLYVVQIVSTSSDGGTSTHISSLLVDGEFKPGRMTTSFADHEVGLGGLPLQVVRSYDSFDKSVGDFGVGWQVGIADFRVTTATPLGLSGWSAQSESCGLIFCTLKYTSSRPHYVSIVWPDGHQEVFDLVGVNGSTFFPGIAQAKFVARRGTNTTSTLEVVGDNSLFFIGDSAYGGAFGTDGLFDPSTFKLTDSHGTSYVVDRTDGLETMTDRAGNTLTFTDDGVTSSVGESIDYTRDAQGRIVTISSPAGSTSYAYDHGDLVTSTDLAGVDTTYTYDDHHNLIDVQGPGGRSLGSTEYDAEGRMTAWIDGEGNRTVLDTDVDARQERVTDPAGRLLTVSSYDTDGNLVRQDQTFDGETLTTRWTYDANLRPVTQTSPSGATTHVAWTPNGDVATVEDALGRTFRYEYDASGNLIREIGPDGVVAQRLSYDEVGNVVEQEGRDGTVIRFEYDSQHRLVRLVSDGTTMQTFTYDDKGRVATISDAGSLTKTYGYDAAGRVVSYDDGANPATSFAYDDLGRLVKTVDANGGERLWQWGTDGALLAETDPLGQVTRYEYDSAGRLRAVTDRNGDATTYTYDPNGRVVRQSSRTNTTTFAYDGLGRLVRTADDDAALDLSYDADSNLVRQVQSGTDGSPLPTVRLDYAYDGVGALRSVTGPDGAREYRYDGAGRLSQVVDNDGGVFEFGYDARDRLTGIDMPNGVSDQLVWNGKGQLERRTFANGGSVLADFQFEHSATGDRTAMVDASGRHEYLYDPTGRLTGADHPGSSGFADEQFSYDSVGNRFTGSQPATAPEQYDAAYRIRQDGRFRYETDNEGQVVKRIDRQTGDTRTYTWGVDGTLLSMQEPGHRVDYRYDPLGHRVEVASSTDGVRRFVYDGSNVAYVLDGGNQVVEAYTTTDVPGMALSRSAGDAKSYPITDDLGSVVGWTAADGSVTGRTEYSAFGVAASPTESAVYGYTGHQYDGDTGLVYARARYYDPASGRFLSEDPVPAINPYPYAENRPCTLTDPTGATAAVSYARLSRLGSEIARFLGQEAGSYVCATLLNTVLTMSGLPPSNAKGQAAEDFFRKFVQGGKPGTVVPYQGAQNMRYPDFIENGRFGEIKNVLRQAFTKQLRDYVDNAPKGRTPILVVRHNTVLSGPLQRAAASGKILILQCLPG